MEGITQERFDLQLQEILDSHVSGLRRDVHRLIGDLPQAPPPPTVDADADEARAMALLRESVESIQGASGQRDLAERLLDAAARHADRTALLLVRGNRCLGFDSRGFAVTQGDLSSFAAMPDTSDPLGAALQRGETQHFPGSSLTGSALMHWLGDERPAQVCLAPIVVGENTVGIVYADSGPRPDSGAIRPEALEILATVAALYLERLRPMNPENVSYDEAGSDPYAYPAGETAPSPASTWTAYDEDAPAAPRATEATEVSETPRSWAAPAATETWSEPAPPPPPPFESGRWESEAADADEAQATEHPQAEASDPGLDALPPIDLDIPEPSAIPEAEATPMASATDGASPENEAAARFARLLVSEIVLYNEAAVKTGQKKGGLYDRLKEPIDRSRTTYRERFGEDLDPVFEAELIATLAGGNRDLLGKNF